MGLDLRKDAEITAPIRGPHRSDPRDHAQNDDGLAKAEILRHDEGEEVSIESPASPRLPRTKAMP
jgi:hypothetical protein